MTPRMFYTLARVLAALTVIPFHEAGHALAAWLLGDPTAKQQGRLSLNPFRHFDLLGTLCMVFAGVGWAKPVSTDPRNFKNPKQGMALTALAGPVANLILAYLAMVVWKLLYYWAPVNDATIFLALFLQYHTIIASEALSGHFTDRCSADTDLSTVHIIKTHQKIDECRLTAARRPYDCHALSRLYGKVEILDQLLFRRIREIYMGQFYASVRFL